MSGPAAAGGGRAVVRRRSAAAALVAAAALGLATGRFVLPPPSGAAAPAPVTARAGASVPASAPASSASGSARPKGASGPVTTANMVDAAAFSPDVAVGRIHVADRSGDRVYDDPACTGEQSTVGGPSAHFRGLMTGTRTAPDDPTAAFTWADQVASEVAAEAMSPALAQNLTERLLLEEGLCQDEPAGHWVYGKTTTLQLAPDVTASWMGYYQGTLNTTGRAPEGKEPCGGVAVLRSGSHYGTLEIGACLGTAAMNRVVRIALSRL